MAHFKDKLIAAGIHLFISACVALVVILLLIFHWFPGSLIELGAIQGGKIMLAVDLVLGPLCTFIVYKKMKPSLKFDLSVIALIQIAALVYGMYMINSQRPAYLVLSHEGLSVVNRLDLNLLEKDVLSDISELKNLSLEYAGKVPVVLLREPEEAGARDLDKIAFEITSGMPYILFTERYTALTELNSASPIVFGSISFEDGCYALLLNSSHGSKQICIQQEGGKIIEK